MRRRSRLPVLLLTFLLAFAASAAAGYALRSRQLRDDEVLTSAAVTVVETTAAASTLLSTDTSVADTTSPTETTVADTEPPTTKAATTTKADKRSTPQLTNDGALLRPVTDRRLFDEAAGCDSLAKSGGADSCGRIELGGVQIAWVLDADGGIDVLVRDPAVDGPDVWNVALHSDSTPVREPRIADVTGDGQAELVVGWRNDQRVLAVDVVEVRDGNPGVSLHLALVDGRVSAGDGQLDAWNGVPQNGDNPDKPSSFDHWIYRRTDGRWQVEAERDDSPPSGQL